MVVKSKKPVERKMSSRMFVFRSQMIHIQMPDEWKNFRIVETVEGCFTGMVSGTLKRYDKEDQKILQDVTRDLLQRALSMTIEKYSDVIKKK